MLRVRTETDQVLIVVASFAENLQRLSTCCFTTAVILANLNHNAKLMNNGD